MPKRREEQKFAPLGEKDCWHPYGLQILSPSKFATVVGKIIRGKYNLISTRFTHEVRQSRLF